MQEHRLTHSGCILEHRPGYSYAQPYTANIEDDLSFSSMMD
jgi:hypothetical protein